MQMSFMIVAIFIFFVMVALGYIIYESRDLKNTAMDFQREKAISSLNVITNMPELRCGSSESAYEELCLDEDKVVVMMNLSGNYSIKWPVAFVKVREIYPGTLSYVVYDSGQKEIESYSSFIALCKRERDNNFGFKCGLGKLEVGMKRLA